MVNIISSRFWLLSFENRKRWRREMINESIWRNFFFRNFLLQKKKSRLFDLFDFTSVFKIFWPAGCDYNKMLLHFHGKKIKIYSVHIKCLPKGSIFKTFCFDSPITAVSLEKPWPEDFGSQYFLYHIFFLADRFFLSASLMLNIETDTFSWHWKQWSHFSVTRRLLFVVCVWQFHEIFQF